MIAQSYQIQKLYSNKLSLLAPRPRSFRKDRIACVALALKQLRIEINYVPPTLAASLILQMDRGSISFTMELLQFLYSVSHIMSCLSGQAYYVYILIISYVRGGCVFFCIKNLFLFSNILILFFYIPRRTIESVFISLPCYQQYIACGVDLR